MYANKILKARKKIMIWIAVNHAGRQSCALSCLPIKLIEYALILNNLDNYAIQRQ